MNKKAFNKENATELLSQLKKVINRDISDEYNEELEDLSQRVDKALKKEKSASRVASNFIKKTSHRDSQERCCFCAVSAGFLQGLYNCPAFSIFNNAL